MAEIGSVCLRCHQKCIITCEVEGGKIVRVENTSPENKIPPCMEACPLGMDIPGYVMAVSRGKFEEAMTIVRDTNPLPSICGRVCHHPCELDCNRNSYDEPVAIQWIKRLVSDHYQTRYPERPIPIDRTKTETVAIIGSGPAGLTAAHDLVKEGYGVTVYESEAVAGGLMSTTIPEFKLPQAIVQADIDYIKGLGVKIKTNTLVGKELSIDTLLRKYDAVLVAIGSQKSMSLDIPGSDLRGIHAAMALLKDVKQGKKIRFGRKVVVIGGGDTAMAAARTAIRLGALEVCVTCLEARKLMPARIWEIEKAVGEGIRIQTSLAPKRFISHDNTNVSGIEFEKVAFTQVDENHRVTWKLQEGPDSECLMDTDAVIVAIGQSPEISRLGLDSKPRVSATNTLIVNHDTLATEIPGLFAAGDVVVGAGTIVDSMAAGRKAAFFIIKYLGDLETKTASRKRLRAVETPSSLAEKMRQQMPILKTSEALRSFQEVEIGYDEQMGAKEANRCLNCVTSCIKGATIPDVMYHPDRLLYPLRRTGARGEGKWERISWDEAIGTIGRKLKEIKNRNGPEAVHVSCGSGQKHIGMEAMAIAKKLWPTPNVAFGRYTCIIPNSISDRVTFGDIVTYEWGQDYEHTKCMVFWGADPDMGTPAQARLARRALRQGAKCIVIDPRAIPMAKRANIWLKIRPGTDAALALAMLNVIINEELYDKEFVKKWCLGFSELKEHVQKYPPQWAAKITSLLKEDIVDAARVFATTKPACVYVRLGAGSQQVTSFQTSRAISILTAIAGNIDVPGGNLLYKRTFHDELYWPTYDLGASIRTPAAVEEKRMGAKEYPFMHQIGMCDVPGTVRAMDNGEIRALWCVANNLIGAEMNSRKIWDVMKNKLEFIFVSELFMTPTAELADIVLPAAFYTEVDELVEAFVYPSNYVEARRRVVEPLGQCRDDREVAIEVAKEMGVDVAPWESVERFFDWRLKYLGITYAELCQRTTARATFPRAFRRNERSTPPFLTASGKVDLYSTVLESLGLDPLPTFKEPPESPISTPSLFEEFPLIYAHYRVRSFQHTEGRQIPRQRMLAPYPELEIHPDTASKLGIGKGDWVYLETPSSRGKWRISFKAKLVPELRPDVVAGPHGWWFPERPGPEHGCFDSNINALLTHDPPYDPVVGNVQCRAFLCRVEKADSQLEVQPLTIPINRKIERIGQATVGELKTILPSTLNEIREYDVEKALGEVPDLLSRIIEKLVEIDAARFMDESAGVSDNFMDLLWEGVSSVAVHSEEMNSILLQTRDMRINLEASDSSLRGHFEISQGKISGSSGLLDFKEQDIRLLGQTQELLKLLRGEVIWGLGNLKLKTEGMPGLLPFASRVIRGISKIINGKY